MKRTLAVLTAVALSAAPTSAVASLASVRLMLSVPVRCTLEVVGGSVIDNALILQVHRNCNAAHEVLLSGLGAGGLNNISVSYNGDYQAVAGNSFSLSQAQRYYDQTDRIVIEAANASPEKMRQLAGSLQLSVVVA